MWRTGFPTPMVCSRTPSKKSHTLTCPSKEPVISWYALCGFKMADVMVSVWLPTSRFADNVDTTSPVVVEYIFTLKPMMEKKYLKDVHKVKERKARKQNTDHTPPILRKYYRASGRRRFGDSDPRPRC